jgi:hypothetical protein
MTTPCRGNPGGFRQHDDAMFWNPGGLRQHDDAMFWTPGGLRPAWRRRARTAEEPCANVVSQRRAAAAAPSLCAVHVPDPNDALPTVAGEPHAVAPHAQASGRGGVIGHDVERALPQSQRGGRRPPRRRRRHASGCAGARRSPWESSRPATSSRAAGFELGHDLGVRNPRPRGASRDRRALRVGLGLIVQGRQSERPIDRILVEIGENGGSAAVSRGTHGSVAYHGSSRGAHRGSAGGQARTPLKARDSTQRRRDAETQKRPELYFCASASLRPCVEISGLVHGRPVPSLPVKLLLLRWVST